MTSQQIVNPLLSVDGLTKRYSVTVLDGVSFDLRPGEIHALLGANGAGKSTLCRIIAGLVEPSDGGMKLNGRPYAPASKQDAESDGVQIIQQELNLIPTLSVAENLMLNRLPNRSGIIRKRELHQRARRALDRFSLQDVATETLVGSLGVGRQQMIEIAAALDCDCQVLILDEPTAALSAGETERLFDWLAKLREQGVGMIYISHRLDEVARMADRVTVLRDGQYVCTESTAGLTSDAMVDLMTGDREGSLETHQHETFATEKIALRVKGLARGALFKDVSFEVRAGERFGIAGLVGSGRTELLRAIYGADLAEDGGVGLAEYAIRRFRHPTEAVAAGLAMVTEDRKQNGLLLEQSIRVNTTLCALQRDFSRSGVVRRRAERETAESMCQKMETRCTSIEQSTTTLSGGNQQKVVVGKWLVRNAQVFLLDEPTRGIDVAARRRIYRLLDSLARNGKALVIVSSDLDELLETCDRIAVMSAGRLVATFDRDDWSHDKIMQAAFQGYTDQKVDLQGSDK